MTESIPGIRNQFLLFSELRLKRDGGLEFLAAQGVAMTSWVAGRLNSFGNNQFSARASRSKRSRSTSKLEDPQLRKARAISHAERCIISGNLQSAIEYYEAITRQDAEDLSSLNRLGDLWARFGNLVEALSCFSQTAEAYLKQGFKGKAIATFKKMLRVDPRNPFTALKLANLHVKDGLFAEAEQYFRQAAHVFIAIDQPHRALEVELAISRMKRPGDLYSKVEKRFETLAGKVEKLQEPATRELDKFEFNSLSPDALQTPEVQSTISSSQRFELVTDEDRPTWKTGLLES